MMRGARAGRRPPVPALAFADLHIIDAGLAPAHQAVLVEFPLLIAVGAEPLSGVVMPFVLETHSDEIAVERPEILDQPVLVFLLPLAREEGDDRGAAFEEFRAIPPPAVFGVGQCHPLGIARIPGVLRHAGLLGGGLAVERGKRWTRHATVPSLSVPIGPACPNNYSASSP